MNEVIKEFILELFEIHDDVDALHRMWKDFRSMIDGDRENDIAMRQCMEIIEKIASKNFEAEWTELMSDPWKNMEMMSFH